MFYIVVYKESKTKIFLKHCNDSKAYIRCIITRPPTLSITNNEEKYRKRKISIKELSCTEVMLSSWTEERSYNMGMTCNTVTVSPQYHTSRAFPTRMAAM